MSIEPENLNHDGPSSYVLPGPRRDALYDLLTELCLLDEREHGQLSDMERHEIEAERADIYQRLMAKTDRLAAFMRHQEQEYERINSEILRLRGWRGRIEREQDRIKQYVINSLRTTDTKALRTPTAKIALRKIRPAIQFVNELEIPNRFWEETKPTYYPSKTKIAAALDAGEVVPGVKREDEAFTLVVE